MPKKRDSRIYWRMQGGVRRAYGDFRDLGGGREALKVQGEKQATTDPDVAAELASARVRALEAQRRNRVILGVEKEATLEAFAAHHLLAKAKAEAASDRWMVQSERHLDEAVQYFGKDRLLTAIRVEDVRRWAERLAAQPGRAGERVSAGTVRHRLNVLSNLYRRAISEGYVPSGYNPVSGLMDKPTPARAEARWLEAHEAALLLESARTYRAPVEAVEQEHGGAISAKPNPHLHAILATFLLTGGRKSEVLGLEVDDVSFQRKTITFRPNGWRRLKTRTSHRPVRLWPQLEEILRAYLMEREQTGGLGALLFPSVRPPRKKREQEEEGAEVMIQDVQKGLDAVAKRAGWKAGEVTTKMFRHTYCAARLQTLDRGAPVAPWTVARELGHSSTEMVERIYGHLGQVRHRGEEVSFRVEDHKQDLGDRLVKLQQSGG
jgi:integrase